MDQFPSLTRPGPDGRLRAAGGRLLASAALFAIVVSCSLADAPLPEGNLVANASFEDPREGVPAHWVFDEPARDKGEVGIVETPRGKAVELRPNARNVPQELESNPLSIGQVFTLDEYPGLRGATLFASAELGARGPASAAVRLIAIRKGGHFIGTELEQGASDRGLTEHRGSLAIPDDGKTIAVVLGLDARGTAGSAIFDNVYLGTVPKERGPAIQRGAPVGAPAHIRVDAARTLRRIPEGLFGVNLEWIWDGNGLYNEETDSLDEDIVRLTRELRPSVLRFPGGIFADFYRWRNGVGPRGARPTTEHFPSGPESRHNVGTDEALELARRSGAQLMVTVNIATAEPDEAVEWLRYINRPEETRGQPPLAPFWEIGNENYFTGDAPYLRAAALDAHQYAERFLAFAEALKHADPRIEIVAVAEENYQRDFEPVHPDWIPLLLSKAGHAIDYLAVHNGYVPGLEQDPGWDVRTVYQAMLAAPIQLRRSLDRVAEQVREHAPKHSSRIKLAVTEWGPSFQLALDGRFLDHTKTLGSALFVASNLNGYAANPDLELANLFKLNGRLWQGVIGSRDGRFVAKAPYYAFRMFREHFGSVLVETQTDSPSYDSHAVGYVPALREVPYLDVASSLSEDGGTLYLMIVNKHFDQPIQAKVEISGFQPQPTGRAFVLTGTGIDAHTGTELFSAPGVKWARQATDEHNPRWEKGGPGEIRTEERVLDVDEGTIELEFGPHSVTAIELQRDDP